MRYILLTLLLSSCADWGFSSVQDRIPEQPIVFPDNHCITDSECKNGAICLKQYGYIGLCAKVIDGGLTE